MPHLSADSLTSDPEGLAFLRGVLHAGEEPAVVRASPFLEAVQASKAASPGVTSEAGTYPAARLTATAPDDTTPYLGLAALA